MNLWNMLKGEPQPVAEQTRIINGNPLVIADDGGEIAFADRARIEVHQLDEEKLTLKIVSDHGNGRRLDQAEIYLAPETIVLQTMMPYDCLQRGNRGGDAFIGFDEHGEPVTWYLGSAADSIILEKSRANDLPL